MKYLVLLFTASLMLGCTPENNVPLPGQEVIENVLRNNILEKENAIAKFHADQPQDSIGKDIYLTGLKISEAANKNLALIDDIHYDLSETNTRKQCTEIFADMQQMVLNSTDKSAHKNYPPLQTASGNKYENKILLMAYTHEVLSALRSKLIPFCGISLPYKFWTITDQKIVRKGESFTCLNMLEGTHQMGGFAYPVKIERIIRDGKQVDIRNIKTRFDNRFTEYAPEETGKYTILFSQKVSHPSGRTETYPSEISFEVIP